MNPENETTKTEETKKPKGTKTPSEKKDKNTTSTPKKTK